MKNIDYTHYPPKNKGCERIQVKCDNPECGKMYWTLKRKLIYKKHYCSQECYLKTKEVLPPPWM